MAGSFVREDTGIGTSVGGAVVCVGGHGKHEAASRCRHPAVLVSAEAGFRRAALS